MRVESYYLHTAPRTAKIAMSLPVDLYRALERIRKTTGQPRSALIRQALRYWLERQREEALARRYESGYRLHPEDSDEIRRAEAAAVELLASQEW
ncbi:MAG TPA: ribbon-helix-helix domain-containing protein [Bryobacterales bacterium]|nr:ribbon-helix-helix domain-containing protein [Bryobacterales bacterium]